MSANDPFNDPAVAALRNYDKESSDYLKDMLFGDKLEKRQKWHDLLHSDPVFHFNLD